MALLVGIDEAGYGPLLGPLVVSSVALELPEALLRKDLWDILQRAVSSQKRGLSGRLLITDSKKAYNRKSGLGHLQRTVHAVLAAASGNGHDGIKNAQQLVSQLSPICAERLLEGYPWYQELEKQTLETDENDIQIASGVLQRAMSEHGVALHSVRSRCLDVGFYNSRVEVVKNKSRVLFTELCSLITDIQQRNVKHDTLQVVVDRQGGRINYQQELLRMFPGSSLSVLRQDETMSSYELINDSGTMRIHFCIKADLKYLPVSLASMVSKYLREVMMMSLNGYFVSLCPDLKPTAGYWQDGQRFVRDLKNLNPNCSYAPKKLIRIS